MTQAHFRGRRLLPMLLITLLTITPSARATDEAPAARAYHTQLLSMIDAIAHDMADITRASELAAQAYITGKDIGIRGDSGLASEMSNRAGGFTAYRGARGIHGDIIIYALGITTRHEPDAEKLLRRQLADAQIMRSAGSIVIGIASHEQLKAHDLLDRAQEACDVLLNNHAPANDGLFCDENNKHFVPTFTSVNAIIAWTLHAELFAACTRLGHTPTVHRDVHVDTRQLWLRRYWATRFHDDVQTPAIEAGLLGKEYLKQLRGVLTDVGTASWTGLARTAHRASDTLAAGDKVYLRAAGVYVPHHVNGQLAHDPNLFAPLDHDGSNPNAPRPGWGDFVIAVGTAEPANSAWWGEPQLLRGAGRGVSWIISDYLTQPHDLTQGDILVNQAWPVGDALVRVPGYPAKIGPASGVVSEAILWMITAEVHAQHASHRSAMIQP